MSWRKTPSERKQEKVEAAEWSRRWRAGEPMGDPKVRSALDEYDRALREVARASQLPDPTGVEPFVCEKHEWRPSRRAWWQPLPQRSQCPACKAGIDEKPVGPDVPIATAQSGLFAEVKEPLPTLEIAWRNHTQRLAEDGVLLPGSDAEDEALARIEQLREEERRERGLVKVYEGFPYNGTRVMHRRRSRPKRRSWDYGDEIIVEA